MTTVVVNTHEAKSRLSELIRAAERGDEVIVARNGHPVVKIIPWPPARPERVHGAWAGKVRVGDDVVASDPDVVRLFDAAADADQP